MLAPIEPEGSSRSQHPRSNRACGFPAHGLPVVVGTQHCAVAPGAGASLAPPPGCHTLWVGTSRSVSRPAPTWLRPRAAFAVVALFRQTDVQRGASVRSCRPIPQAYLLSQHDHRRNPSFQPRYAPQPSSPRLAPGRPVLRSPRTPAAHGSTSPLAYTSAPAPTRAAQTGLSRSEHVPARVLRPIPRRSHPSASDLAAVMLPSP